LPPTADPNPGTTGSGAGAPTDRAVPAGVPPQPRSPSGGPVAPMPPLPVRPPGPHPMDDPAPPRGTARWTDPGAVAAQEAQRARCGSDQRATDLSSARLLRPTPRP